MKIEQCSIREAGEKLSDWFGLKFERSRKSTASKAPRSETTQAQPTASPPIPPARAMAANPPLDRPLRDLNQDHSYLAARGLTIPTIREFGMGYCSRGLMRGRIAIPIHDEHGQLVAYAGRAVEESLAEKAGRYRLPESFRKGHVLFNLHRVLASGDRATVIVEGFMGCFKLHQAGFPNVVAIMGSTLSEAQEALLVSHFDRLALMFDGDDAGTKCLREFYARLRRRLYLREIHLEPGEQPDSLSDDRIRDLLS
jgi:DNA primase